MRIRSVKMKSINSIFPNLFVATSLSAVVLISQVSCQAQQPKPNSFNSSPPLVEEKIEAVRKEEFSFQSLGVTLQGTLWLPDSGGPYPAVVCVHGSGKITRKDTYANEFAEYFVKRGVAVLTYDKRGVGKSGGTYVGSFGGSMVVYAADAVSAIQRLKKRDDIVGSKIGLFGVSQGGFVIPLAAAMDKKDVAFSIIISGPIVSIGEQNLYNDLTGNAAGKPTGKKRPEITEKLKAYGSKGYDPSPFVVEMFKPGLWIWGALDKTIPVEESLAELKAIKAEFKRKFTWKIFPNGDHGLKKSKTGYRTEIPRPTETVDGYFETMERWLVDIKVLKGVSR